jgi:hypothetical protein
VDFDPRDYDSRDEQRFEIERGRGSRGASDEHDGDHGWNGPAVHSRDRDEYAREPGRGPGSDHRNDDSNEGVRERDDARWAGRDRDPREMEPRDLFMRDLDLPRGREREIVHDGRGREYTLRASETRTLSTVGAFRVVSARDLRDHHGRPADPRSGDLRHLREQGLIRLERVDGYRDVAVVLTKEGRGLLTSHRSDRSQHHDWGHRYDREQTFYADLKKPREVEHDSQVYRAYLREAEKLADRGAHIDRVVLDYELKREYQQWLHERDKEREDADGRPDREPAEIADWASDHDLPYFDDQVHFPDLRIEYETPDGRWDRIDVEVVTLHYRGAHGAAAARSGFSSYSGTSARLRGGGGGGGRGGGRSGEGLADELLD